MKCPNYTHFEVSIIHTTKDSFWKVFLKKVDLRLFNKIFHGGALYTVNTPPIPLKNMSHSVFCPFS